MQHGAVLEVSVHIYIRAYIHTYIHTDVFTYIGTYICMCLCACVWVAIGYVWCVDADVWEVCACVCDVFSL